MKGLTARLAEDGKNMDLYWGDVLIDVAVPRGSILDTWKGYRRKVSRGAVSREDIRRRVAGRRRERRRGRTGR